MEQKKTDMNTNGKKGLESDKAVNEGLSEQKKELERAIQMLNKGDASLKMEGFVMLRLLSDKGFVHADEALGFFSRAWLKDLNQAAMWYKKAADGGIARACRIYADMLFDGTGVAQDELESMDYLEKAANLGDAQAMFGMGEFCQSSGELNMALAWFNKAYQGGFEPAGQRIRLLENRVR